MIEQPLGDMEPPLEPEAVNPKNVRIYTSRPEQNDQLRFSASSPRSGYAALDDPQEIEINVRLAGTGKKRVPADAVFRVDFASDDKTVELTVEPATLPLKDGRSVVRVSRKAGDASKGISGRLSFGFKEIERMDILGPREIPIQFAERAKVSIQSVTPATTLQRWPVGKPLQFSIQHTGQSADWDFGDGEKAKGNSLQHIFNRAGVFEIVVRASADKRDSAERRLRIETIAAGLEVKQVPETGVIAGKPVKFKATVIAATPSRFEWIVNGTARSPSKSDPSELEVRFEEPGSSTVELRAYTDLCVLERKVAVQVGAGLSLRIRDFEPSVDAGMPAEFTAEVKGSSKLGRIEWEILDAATKVLVDPLAKGASPIQQGVSKWSLVLPERCPKSVIVRATAALESAERAALGDIVDEVAISVRPAGLNVRKERPADAETLVVGEPNVFEAVWTGTGAASVKTIRWQVAVEGGAALNKEEVQASQAAGAASSSFSVTLPSSADVLGKKILVSATPLVGDSADDSHAAVWQLSARLPRVDYRIVTNAIEMGTLKYGTSLQVTLEPTIYAESVDWDWGDGKTQAAAPSAAVEHSYTLADAGSRRVIARVRRTDGAEVLAQLLFDFRVPSFEIRNPGLVRVNRNVSLSIGPDELSVHVKEVSWDFGAGYLAPEADLETSHMWTDRVGPVPVRAKLALKDGTERFVPELTVNVVESATVKADPDVVGGDSAGAVELYANITPDSDYLGVKTEVLRDGKVLAVLDGPTSSYVVPDEAYGTYEFHFVASRLPSPENPATTVELGTIPRTYREVKYFLFAMVTVLGSLLLAAFCWGLLLYQYPRKWRLCATTEDPLKFEDFRSEVSDKKTLTLGSKSRSVPRPTWGVFRWRKEIDLEARHFVELFRSDEGLYTKLSWLASSSDRLRVSATSRSSIVAILDSWDSEMHATHRTFKIFKKLAPKSARNSASLYVWLDESKPRGALNYVALALFLAWGLWLIWFATNRCGIGS
jgi:hypothetical protein